MVSYDASVETPSVERFEIALNTPAGRVNTVLDVPTGFVPITSIVPVTRRLGEEMLKLEEVHARETGRSISCQMGCAACCRMLVPLSPPEAFALQDYVDQLPADRRSKGNPPSGCLTVCRKSSRGSGVREVRTRPEPRFPADFSQMTVH